MPSWWKRLRDTVAWRRRDRDMHDEMALHLAALEREYRAQGLSDEAACQAARHRFGNLQRLKEKGHDMRGWVLLEDVVRETRHTARRLVRAPGFTLAALLTLALAIGANVSIFTVVHRVVLNPLPYPDSQRVVQLAHVGPGEGATPFSFMALGFYDYYRERARSLDAVAVYRSQQVTLTGRGRPERIQTTAVTPSLGPVLAVQPAVGRWFTEDEGRPGASPVVVLSHGLWLRRYGGDPTVVGQIVTLNSVPTVVVGVMPQSFAFPDATREAWTADRLARSTNFGNFTHSAAVARLREGVSVEATRAELNQLLTELPEVYPDQAPSFPMRSAPMTLREATVGNIERTLWVLLGAVGVVLLVGCTNVANLFLVRAESRHRELAIRRALGAGRMGTIGLFLAESAVLSTGGGLAGLAVAWVALRLLIGFGPTTLPRLDEVRLDGVSVAVTGGMCIAIALLLAAIPLRQQRSAQVVSEPGRHNTASRGRHRTRRVMMGVQVALALVLLVGSGLMVRSFQNLRALEIGFDPSSTLTFRVGLPERDYDTRDAAVATHEAILDRLSSMPGAATASGATCLPLVGDCFFGFRVLVEGRDLPEGTLPPLATGRGVTGDFTSTLRIPVRRGRGLERGDIVRRDPVAVISESLAEVAFPDEDPLGQRVTLFTQSDWPRTWFTIVGVVADTPSLSLDEASPMPTLYMPMSLAGGPDIPPTAMVGPTVSEMYFAVRTTMAPFGLLSQARQAVEAVNPDLALADVRTLDDVHDAASAQMAFTMGLLGVAGGVSLLLGVIGIYGVMSYIVSQRTGEIGVRMALGAAPRGVATLIVRQGGTVAVVGMAVGALAALAGGRLVESLLFGITPRDPMVFAAVALAVLTVALVACWLPARRAAHVDPVEALRRD